MASEGPRKGAGLRPTTRWLPGHPMNQSLAEAAPKGDLGFVLSEVEGLFSQWLPGITVRQCVSVSLLPVFLCGIMKLHIHHP